MKYKGNLIEKLNETKHLFYPTDFEIICEDIFIDLSQNKNSIKEFKCSCIFNNGKIIIKYIDDERKNYLLLIGNLDKATGGFCYEMIIN